MHQIATSIANVIINAGFVMIKSARVGVGRFAEWVRARDFPLSIQRGFVVNDHTIVRMNADQIDYARACCG